MHCWGGNRPSGPKTTVEILGQSMEVALDETVNGSDHDPSACLKTLFMVKKSLKITIFHEFCGVFDAFSTQINSLEWVNYQLPLPL
jgi:hypothetical protein